MTQSPRAESEVSNYAEIAHSLSVLQTQNATLQAELAQCRQDLAQSKVADCTLEPFRDHSEEWLRLAIDLNQISLWSWEPATGKTEWNENNYRLLGYEVGAVKPSYERWLDRLHPDDRVRVETTPAQAIQTRSVRQLDYRVIYADGSIHWIVDCSRWRYDATGRPVQLMGVAIDITERKAMEEAYHALNHELERHVQAQTQQLQASESRLCQQEREFRTLAENSPDGIFRFDLEWRYLYLNPAAEKTLGFPRSAVLGKRDRDLNLPAEAIAFWEQTLQTVVQNRELITVEFSTSTYNGGQWLQSHNIPEFDAAGNLTSILVIERNITALKHTEAALRQSEARFQRLLARLPGVIYQFRVAADGTQSFPYISTYFEQLYGISVEAVLNDASVLLNSCHPEERARLDASIAVSHKTLQPWIWEGRFIKISGQNIWIQAASNPELQPNGDVLWDGILIDISDRKHSEAEHLRLEAERQQAVEALRHSEEQLRAIFDNAPIAISLVDVYDYGIVTSNAAHCQLLGYSDEEFAKMTFVDFTHPDDISTDIDQLQQLIAGNQSQFHLEKRYITKKGDIVLADLVVTLICDRDGNPRYSLGMFQDITAAKQHEMERQQAEETLRQSEEQFRAFFENAPIAIGLAGIKDHRMIRSNAKYQEMLGYSHLELCQMTFMDITHADDVSVDLSLFRQLLAGSISRFQMEKRYICKNGDILWIDLTVALIYDLHGKPLYSLCMPQDITEAKRLDVVRRQTEEALRRSQASLAEAQRIAHVGSWEMDLATQQGTWSDELFRLFGLSPDQPIPTPEQIIEFIYPDDRPMYHQIMQQALEQGEPHQVDHRLLRTDGSVMWMSSMGRVERDAAGNINRLFGVALDISDRKQAEQTLRQHADREQLLRLVSQHIYQSLELDEVLTVAVDEVRQTLQADRVLIFHLIANGSGVVVKESVVPDYPSIEALWFEDEHFPLSCYEFYLQGNPRIVDHAELNTWGECLIPFVQQTQVQSKMVAPIIQQRDEAPHLWGLLIVHACAEPRQWQPAEAELVQQIAHQLAIAIQQANLHHQVQTELSDRKQAEMNLRRSLQEKEVLLKEVHHRVKNNLQIISSLLRMQSRKVDNPQTFTVLQESQNRVQSMALIHEQLYQSADLTQIDLNEYLHNLVSNLFRSYGISPQQVTFRIETNDTYLDLNLAISCGLIINELVSNSLKYAFPADQFGTITVCLTSGLDELAQIRKGILRVMDNGVGIPITIDWQNSPSLGMRIVRNLVQQIKGEMMRLNQPGTAFEITFAIADPTPEPSY